MNLFELGFRLVRLFGTTYIAKECGHGTKRAIEVSAFGYTRKGIFKKDDLQYCSDCLVNMTIKCAWCGKPIFVGDPVTLYTPMKEDFIVPKHAVIYKKDPLQLVGCLRWDCADTGVDRSGFWVPPGKVQRVLSPIEILMGRVAEGDCSAMICDDLLDPSKAIPIKD